MSDLVNTTNIIKVHVPKDEEPKEEPEQNVKVTRSKTKALFGEGKPRKPNKWLEHCKETQKNNPDLSYKEILNIASKTYNK